MFHFDHDKFYADLEAHGIKVTDKRKCSACGTITFKYKDTKSNVIRTKGYRVRGVPYDNLMLKVYRDLGVEDA